MFSDNTRQRTDRPHRSSTATTAHPTSSQHNIGALPMVLLCTMETLQRPTLLRWALHTQGARLFHQHQPVLDLVHEPGGDLRFTYAGKDHTLRTRGTWKPRTVILCAGAEVLRTLDTGLFQPQQCALADGSVLSVAWSNAPLAKLALRDGQGCEVLSLRLAPEGGVHTETVLAAGVPLDERAVLLLAFAYKLFSGVMRGEGTSDDLPLGI